MMVMDDAAPPLPFPAFPSTAPQLVTRGGKILKTPKLALLTYTGDPMTADATSFLSAVGKSSYWATVTKEYGVGPATALTPVTLTDPAPGTIDSPASSHGSPASSTGRTPAYPRRTERRSTSSCIRPARP